MHMSSLEISYFNKKISENLIFTTVHRIDFIAFSESEKLQLIPMSKRQHVIQISKNPTLLVRAYATD